MVMNFVECEIQSEQPFEEPVDRLYKDYAEIVGFKEKHPVQLQLLQIPAYPLITKKPQANLKITNLLVSYQKNSNPSKILIAEPEPDILSLFKAFLETRNNARYGL